MHKFYFYPMCSPLLNCLIILHCFYQVPDFYSLSYHSEVFFNLCSKTHKFTFFIDICFSFFVKIGNLIMKLSSTLRYLATSYFTEPACNIPVACNIFYLSYGFFCVLFPMLLSYILLISD